MHGGPREGALPFDSAPTPNAHARLFPSVPFGSSESHFAARYGATRCKASGTIASGLHCLRICIFENIHRTALDLSGRSNPLSPRSPSLCLEAAPIREDCPRHNTSDSGQRGLDVPWSRTAETGSVPTLLEADFFSFLCGYGLTARIDLGKIPGQHSPPQPQINADTAMRSLHCGGREAIKGLTADGTD